MQQEFITLNGKITLDKDQLFIRNYYFKVDFEVWHNLITPILWWIFFILHFFFDEPRDSKWKVFTILLAFIALLRTTDLYYGIFKRSYANKIFMNDLVGYELQKDNVGYVTTLKLKLKSGKIRPVRFRTHEGQLEPFIEAITPYLARPLPA